MVQFTVRLNPPAAYLLPSCWTNLYGLEYDIIRVSATVPSVTEPDH